MIPILILAGGQSRRMRGRDKLLEPVGGIPLLRHVALQALATGHPVHVATLSTSPERGLAIVGLDLVLHRLDAAREGQSGTLRAGVAALPACEAFLVMLGDMPDIRAEDIAAVIAARGRRPDARIWRGAAEDGTPGHPILFDGTLREEFARLSGDEGGKDIVARHRDKMHLVPLPGRRALTDLDTPEDWEAWRG